MDLDTSELPASGEEKEPAQFVAETANVARAKELALATRSSESADKADLEEAMRVDGDEKTEEQLLASSDSEPETFLNCHQPPASGEEKEPAATHFAAELANVARAKEIALATCSRESATKAGLDEVMRVDGDEKTEEQLLASDSEPGTKRKKRKRRKKKKLEEGGITSAGVRVDCDAIEDDCGELSTTPDSAKQRNERTEETEAVENRQENLNQTGGKKKRNRRRKAKGSGSQANEEAMVTELENTAKGEELESRASVAESERKEARDVTSLEGTSSGKKKRNKHRKPAQNRFAEDKGFEESGERQGSASAVKPVTPRSQDRSPRNYSPYRTPMGSGKRNRPLFEQHWSHDKVSEGLKKEELVKGVLRISPRNFELAWVSVPGLKRDIVLEGMLRRNRALNGDVVALQILPREKWKVMKNEMEYNGVSVAESVEKVTEGLDAMSLQSPVTAEGLDAMSLRSPVTPSTPHKNSHIDNNQVPEEFLQRTGKVVFIIEKKHSRVASGHLKPFPHPKDYPDALFSPSDSRLPRLRIARDICPPGFFDRPRDFEKTLFVARITSWPETSPKDGFLATGAIARSLGEAGEIEPETEGILLEYGIDSGPFSDEAMACLPRETPWKIPESEVESRRDFRGDCIFSIDPLTARDLDDALHCKKLSDGCFEVGVHIADVSYFVSPGNALDEAAAERGTSTYMVQKVLPMLPRRLCEELCSLQPGVDRLSFSVVWKMSDKGDILDEWKGRGIIRSRVQMAYEHAQDMIEKPNRVWHENELPPISDGATVQDISAQVNQLHKFAVRLRRRRFENGALRLDQVKLGFDIDKSTGLPNGYHVHKSRDANKLIEEFMLLANMAVAHHIYDAYPETALLRRHPKPDGRQLDDLIELCKSFGIQYNGTSSKTIQESLAQFPPFSPEHEVLVNLTMRPMKNAEYFCTGSVEQDQYGHFALCVPLYTHFTSPIRRYPDLVVHRLLAASLGVGQPLTKQPEEIDMIADHCNDRKLAAKRASELSNEMFFGIFVRECGPLEGDGMVVSIMDQSFDVLVPEVGAVKRVYCKFCPGVKSYEFTKGGRGRPAELRLLWSVKLQPSDQKAHEEEQVLKVFSQVRVILTTESETKTHPFKINAKLVPPKGGDQSYAPTSTPNEHEDHSLGVPNPTGDVRQRLFESDDEDKASRHSDDVIVESEEEDDVDNSLSKNGNFLNTAEQETPSTAEDVRNSDDVIVETETGGEVN